MTFGIEQAQELMNFLTEGRVPDGYILTKHPPGMSPKQAFSVLYLLQERYGVISDSFELCSSCGYLFDSNPGGHMPETGAKSFCDNCRILCNCKECRDSRKEVRA